MKIGDDATYESLAGKNLKDPSDEINTVLVSNQCSLNSGEVNALKRSSATVFSFARLGLAFSTLAFDLPTFAGCNVPPYRTGLVVENTATDVTLQISMPIGDFAPERLICTSEDFKRRFPKQNVMVTMFTDHNAAQNYPPSFQEQTAWMLKFYSTLHALYVRNRDTQEDYLLIVPDGRHLEKDSPLNTRIDLPATSGTLCRLAIASRCLLEFKHMDYPAFRDKTDVAGSVIVRGKIHKNGTVSDVVVVDASAETPAFRRFLSDWTVQNLRLWRFDAGQHIDDFRVTFSFVLTDSTPTEIEMRLPDEVRLEGRRRN